MTNKPVIFSGIQPSGSLTIGNYIGAIRHWVDLQHECDAFFVLVDLHAITEPKDPAEFRRRCFEFIGLYLACGIDPEKSTIFVQSHVPAHCELLWILNCFTRMGELKRMTQFKEKSIRHPRGVNAGLFDYPVLMAADILLYETNLVPVGEDQKQHIELARNLAERFNSRYGNIFTIPEASIPDFGARIMSLQNPLSKMSKSDTDVNSYIALTDSPETIRAKIGAAVTDSGKQIRVDANKPGISNLIAVYSAVSGAPIEIIEEEYKGKGYAVFKKNLTELLSEFLLPVRERYAEVIQNTEYLQKVITDGASEARQKAAVILRRVHGAMGFIPTG